MQHNVWRLVKGREPKPEGSENTPAVISWIDKNDWALAIIGLVLGDDYMHHLDLESTAEIVWEKLNQSFGETLNNSKLFLKQQFYKMSISKSASLKEHLSAMSNIIQQLIALKCPPDDDDKKAVLLNSLEDNSEYASGGSLYENLLYRVHSRSIL